MGKQEPIQGCAKQVCKCVLNDKDGCFCAFYLCTQVCTKCVPCVLQCIRVRTGLRSEASARQGVRNAERGLRAERGSDEAAERVDVRAAAGLPFSLLTRHLVMSPFIAGQIVSRGGQTVSRGKKSENIFVSGGADSYAQPSSSTAYVNRLRQKHYEGQECSFEGQARVHSETSAVARTVWRTGRRAGTNCTNSHENGGAAGRLRFLHWQAGLLLGEARIGRGLMNGRRIS
jgi:hypothetical protein